MKYRTIVADPPWEYPGGWGRPPSSRADNYAARRGIDVDLKPRKALPYPSMTLSEIAALPVRELADQDGSHVYLWTTNRYLRAAFGVLDAWGVRYGQTLVWCKQPMGAGLGGAFQNTAEYVLFGRIGSLRHLQRVNSTWFRWPRLGNNRHSRKPEAFLDLVESVSPGPYLELFARRNRLGWDTWGNESLEHISIQAAGGERLYGDAAAARPAGLQSPPASPPEET